MASNLERRGRGGGKMPRTPSIEAPFFLIACLLERLGMINAVSFPERKSLNSAHKHFRTYSVVTTLIRQ